MQFIADTFSKLSHNDESSPLLGKKAANVINNSGSDNDNELLNSSIINDKEILDCLINLPCISSNKKGKKTHTKHSKIHDRKISSDGNKPLLLSSSSDETFIFAIPLLSNVFAISLKTWF